MPRVKRGVTARARHRKVLANAKGYRGARKNVYRVAKQAVMKAGQYAYRDRRQRKRQYWLTWPLMTKQVSSLWRNEPRQHW